MAPNRSAHTFNLRASRSDDGIEMRIAKKKMLRESRSVADFEAISQTQNIT